MVRDLPREESTEQLLGRFIAVERELETAPLSLDDLGGADIDNRRPLLFDEFGKVRQIARQALNRNQRRNSEDKT
jgi:hypothetical protein